MRCTISKHFIPMGHFACECGAVALVNRSGPLWASVNLQPLVLALERQAPGLPVEERLA